MFVSGKLVRVVSADVGLERDGTLAHWVTHSVACTIHSTHPVHVVACTGEA